LPVIHLNLVDLIFSKPLTNFLIEILEVQTLFIMNVFLLKDKPIKGSVSVAQHSNGLLIDFGYDVDIRPALDKFQRIFYKANDKKSPLW